MFSGVFYIKTAQPELYAKAVSFIKSLKESSLETVSDTVYEGLTENESGESGEMLRAAENLSFNYISPTLETALLSNSYTSYALPVKDAVLTSGFGSRTDPVTKKSNATHGGVDLAASKGCVISAYSSGIVKDVGYSEVYGNCVTLSHSDGSESFYGHLSEASVETGEKLSTGDRIGVIGSTGKSTGTHLHFEIRVDGQKVDPMPYIYEKI